MSIQEQSEAAETFSISFTKAQLEFLLFTIGYMKAEAEHCDDDTERFFLEEHLKAIFPKVLGAQKTGPVNMVSHQKVKGTLKDMRRCIEQQLEPADRKILIGLLEDLYDFLGLKNSSQ